MSNARLRELSLFSGGGGGLLASHLLGWEIIGMAEWDKGARSVLKARIADGSLPDVTLHEDVQEIDPSDYIGKVDIVTGGFPCQPFSNAGKRLGADDARNMWPPTVRILKGTGAPHGFFENVASLLSSGYFGTVLGDLVDAGYHISWDCVPASAVGAPHIRDRLWVYAKKIEEGDPSVTPGELPLLTVATFEGGKWTRTTGTAVWSETDELGEPAKWPRAGMVIGNVAHATRRSGYPPGVNKYGTWPMPQLPWVREIDGEQPSVDGTWPTPIASNGNKSVYRWRDDHQNDLNAAVANPERHWATPLAADAKVSTLPPSCAGRDGIVGDVMRDMGFEDKRRGATAPWPTPTVIDADRVDQIRTPDELKAARATGKGGCRNLREEVTHAEERFPTPTASERAGINPKTGKGGGLSRTVKDREMFPTPLAGENRKSSGSMRSVAAGGQSTPPGLAQHLELCDGVVPREFEGIPYDELPPKVRAMFPTPRAKGLVGGTGVYGQITGLIEAGTSEEEACAMFGIKMTTYREAVQERWPTPTQGMHKTDVPDPDYAKRHAERGRQVTLPMAVKLREGDDQERFPTPQAYSSRDSNPPGLTPLDIKVRGLYQDEPVGEPEIWPTPRTGGGSRPNGKGGKVLAEEVQIAEGVRERGEYVDGRSTFPTPTSEDAGRTGSSEAWDEYKEEGRTTGARLRNFTQKFPTPTPTASDGHRQAGGPNRQGGDNLWEGVQQFPTPTCSSGGRAACPGLAAVNAMLRGEEPPYQPMTVDIAVFDELKAAGVKEVISFKTGEMVMESGERAMWPTPTAAVRGGKELDPDHWLESRDRHAERGVNKHYHLDVAVQFADQGRSPDESREMWRTPTSFEGASITDNVEVPSNYKRPLYDQVAGREWEDTAKVGEAISQAPVERMFDAGDTVWPTPNASSGLRGGGHADAAIRDLVEAGQDPDEIKAMFDTRAGGQQHWPTPLASDYKGANMSGSGSASSVGLSTKVNVAEGRSKAAFQTPTASDAKAAGIDGFSPLGRQLDAAPKRAGLLNPEWVAWLMGWPIGWTSPDPLPSESIEEWYAMTRGRYWWHQEPTEVPRLTAKGQTAGSRTVRLKALGNGQVSLCAARAHQVLVATLEGGLSRAKEGDREVGISELFGL